MVSTQSKYEIEWVRGEFGDNYNITIKNDDGSNADISGFDKAKFTVLKPDDTVLFTATTEDASPLVISSPNVVWPMLEAQTTAGSNYDGRVKCQVQLTTSTTKKRMTKIYDGFVYKNKVPT